MTMDDAVRLLRDYVSEVDPATSVLSDEELVLALADALRVLLAKQVQSVRGTEINVDTGDFVAAVSDQVGLILVLKAAITLLWNEYRGRLKRGEFGISWQSGLEQESSVSAAKAYGELIESLASELEQIVMISNVNFAATRPQ